jgi:hypothetical protein
VDASRRRLAEAALAAREGRRDDALSALAVADAKLNRSMDAGSTHLSADQISAVRALLDANPARHAAALAS